MTRHFERNMTFKHSNNLEAAHFSLTVLYDDIDQESMNPQKTLINGVLNADQNNDYRHRLF